MRYRGILRNSTNRRPLALEALEQRAVPAAVPFAVHFSPDEFPNVNRSVAYPTTEGFRLIGFSNAPLTIDEFGTNGQRSGTIELAPPPDFDIHTDVFSLQEFSDDGQWVKGVALQIEDLIPHPLYWNLAHPDRPLTESQLDDASRPTFNNGQAYFDGPYASIIDPEGGLQIAAVTVGGVTHIIHEADGTPVRGGVSHFFTGLGGDPSRWLALGERYAGGPFIAFSDGTIMLPGEFVLQQWPTVRDESPGSVSIHYDIGVFVGNGAILFARKDWAGPFSSGISVGAMHDAGSTFVMVPLPRDWAHTDTDVNADDQVSTVDALLVINALNMQMAAENANGQLPDSAAALRLDINRDGLLTTQDALRVINYLNTHETIIARPLAASPGLFTVTSAAEGESSSALIDDTLNILAADECFLDLATSRRNRPNQIVSGLSRN